MFDLFELVFDLVKNADDDQFAPIIIFAVVCLLIYLAYLQIMRKQSLFLVACLIFINCIALFYFLLSISIVDYVRLLRGTGADTPPPYNLINSATAEFDNGSIEKSFSMLRVASSITEDTSARAVINSALAYQECLLRPSQSCILSFSTPINSVNDHGNESAAIESHRAVMAINYLYTGDLQFEQGQYEYAETAYQNVLKYSDPEFTPNLRFGACSALVDLHEQIGEYEKARSDLECLRREALTPNFIASDSTERRLQRAEFTIRNELGRDYVIDKDDYLELDGMNRHRFLIHFPQSISREFGDAYVQAEIRKSETYLQRIEAPFWRMKLLVSAYRTGLITLDENQVFDFIRYYVANNIPHSAAIVLKRYAELTNTEKIGSYVFGEAKRRILEAADTHPDKYVKVQTYSKIIEIDEITLKNTFDQSIAFKSLVEATESQSSASSYAKYLRNYWLTLLYHRRGEIERAVLFANDILQDSDLPLRFKSELIEWVGPTLFEMGDLQALSELFDSIGQLEDLLEYADSSSLRATLFMASHIFNVKREKEFDLAQFLNKIQSKNYPTIVEATGDLLYARNLRDARDLYVQAAASTVTTKMHRLRLDKKICEITFLVGTKPQADSCSEATVNDTLRYGTKNDAAEYFMALSGLYVGLGDIDTTLSLVKAAHSQSQGKNQRSREPLEQRIYSMTRWLIDLNENESSESTLSEDTAMERVYSFVNNVIDSVSTTPQFQEQTSQIRETTLLISKYLEIINTEFYEAVEWSLENNVGPNSTSTDNLTERELVYDIQGKAVIETIKDLGQSIQSHEGRFPYGRISYDKADIYEHNLKMLGELASKSLYILAKSGRLEHANELLNNIEPLMHRFSHKDKALGYSICAWLISREPNSSTARSNQASTCRNASIESAFIIKPYYAPSTVFEISKLLSRSCAAPDNIDDEAYGYLDCELNTQAAIVLLLQNEEAFGRIYGDRF